MKSLAFLAAVALLAACGGGESKVAPPPAAPPVKKVVQPPPSAIEAQAIILASPEFSEYDFTYAAVTLTKTTTPVTRDAAEQLAKAGWVRLHGDQVTLAPKAEGDKRFLVRPNDTIDVVPLAKKEMIGVTAVKANAGGTADADFDWKWVPNEIGAAFKHGPTHDRYAATQHATATLTWDGRAWWVLRLTPR